MLIAHASSTCDVCLDVYNEDSSYHSIPCGHVFCLPCLVSTTPAKCPLCRHEFSPHTMRKLHLSLPSPRDLAARKLEMKLVQSSPETTLAESLMLFQEVQDWLQSEAEDEFLVLRAFAAVLCGFHETKDKLIQTQARAEEKEAALLRSLDEARSAPQSVVADYKATLVQYKAAKSELVALRAECTELRAKAEQQRTLDVQAQYVQIQAQAQLQVQSQSESQAVTRRISNPLPAPPRPVEIPFLKIIDQRPSKSDDKRKDKDPNSDIDHITSAFVPTISSITTKHHTSGADTPEITTLVFKPPKRMPMWDSPNTSYAPIDASGRPPSDPDSSSRPDSYVGANDQTPGEALFTYATYDPANPPRQSDSASRPVSHPDGNGWAEPPPAPSTAQPPETSRPRAHKQPRESRPTLDTASRPLSYTGLPEPQTSAYIPNNFDSNYAPQRPAWQGGTGVASRRASSPVVMHATGQPNYDLVVAPHRGAGDDWGRSDRRPAAARAYTVGTSGEGPPTSGVHRLSHPQRPSPSPKKSRRPEQESEPELRIPSRRVLRIDPSPLTSGDEAPRASRRSHHAPRPPHGHSRTLSAHSPVTPPRLPSPMPIRERARTHSHFNPAPPFPLNEHHARDTRTGESSRLITANNLYSMDANGPLVPPMAEV